MVIEIIYDLLMHLPYMFFILGTFFIHLILRFMRCNCQKTWGEVANKNRGGGIDTSFVGLAVPKSLIGILKAKILCFKCLLMRLESSYVAKKEKFI